MPRANSPLGSNGLDFEEGAIIRPRVIGSGLRKGDFVQSNRRTATTLLVLPQSGRSSLVLSMMVEKVSTTPLMARKRSMTLSSSSVESVLSMAHRS